MEVERQGESGSTMRWNNTLKFTCNDKKILNTEKKNNDDDDKNFLTYINHITTSNMK